MKRWAACGWAMLVLLFVVPVPSAQGVDSRGFERAQTPEKRVALVIGNNEYSHIEKLRNAVADAQSMNQALSALGFDVVFRQDTNRIEMNDAIDEFTGKLSSDSIALFFYAGHGVQIKSANYLIPVDVNAEKENHIAYNGIDVALILDKMAEARAKFSLAILDACRDNPFKMVSSRGVGTRGLSTPSSNASGIMVVYSAGVNQRALDRLSETDTDPNGLFTREFLKVIGRPGIKVQDTIGEVRQKVIEQARAIGHDQMPAVYDQSVGTFFFKIPTEVAGVVAEKAKKAIVEADHQAITAATNTKAQSKEGGLDFQQYQVFLIGFLLLTTVAFFLLKSRRQKHAAVNSQQYEKTGEKLEPIDCSLVSVRNLVVREKPDPMAGAVDTLNEGDCVRVSGRTEDGKWLYIERNGVGFGYVVSNGLDHAERYQEALDQAREEQERKAKEEEERKKKEQLAEQRAQEEQRAKAEAYRKFREESERKAKALAAERKAQEEEQAKAEAEQRARAEAERRIRAEVEQQVSAEVEQRARAEAEQRARVAAEQRARAEAEQRARVEAEQRARAEAEQRYRIELESKIRAEAGLKVRDAVGLEVDTRAHHGEIPGKVKGKAAPLAAPDRSALSTQRFDDSARDGTVRDNNTGLIWLKNANSFDELNWIAAQAAADVLASGASGLSDNSVAGQWRLPSLEELQSLIDKNQSKPALPLGHPFSGVQSLTYWTSTPHASNAERAWYVTLSRGNAGEADKNGCYYVWPVRDEL